MMVRDGDDEVWVATSPSKKKSRSKRQRPKAPPAIQHASPPAKTYPWVMVFGQYLSGPFCWSSGVSGLGLSARHEGGHVQEVCIDTGLGLGCL